MIIDGCCIIKDAGDYRGSIRKLLKHMDSLSIDKAVLNFSDKYFAWENEIGNEFVIQQTKEVDRFIPVITANLWRTDAWEVLVRYIDQGGKIIAFSPAVQGFSLCDNKLINVCARLTECGRSTPLYLHSGNHVFGAPTQLALLAKKFPKLNFIMGHAGATDYAADVVPVCQTCKNIYLESSFARPPGFISKISQIGFDRGIMGSAYPYNDIEYEWSEMIRLLPDIHRNAVLGGNLKKLLDDAK